MALTNRNLEQLLAGGVKLMTDVLALARPEVFQKAAKVQRWARRLAGHIEVEKAWELDLAALLYPMGVIALSDEIAAKYATNQPMSAAEVLTIEESSLVASRLIANIPRMQGVARTVFYAHKGYDGSGWPKDGPHGTELPQNSRILKVLIDLADEATGLLRTREGAFEKMSETAGRYDPDIFRVAFDVLKTPAVLPTETEMTLTLEELQSGDILVHDLVDNEDRLVLSAGSQLSEMGTQRLLSQSGRLPDTITIVRLSEGVAKDEGDLPDTELF
ncbi:HD domain-containing phosphohydrolase [Devosia sp.]|uniref:HD domain-containing phosphohydrolase n=1 Tax=Devosia sp. TaxID=1871048 RepID=UPI003A91C27A